MNSQSESREAPHQKPFLLGIDAGGSKTQAILWTRGTVSQLQNHRASPNEILLSARWQERFAGLNLDTIDTITANQRLGSLWEQVSYAVGLSTAAMLKRTDIVIGMAGLDTPEDMRQANLWIDTLLLQFGVAREETNIELVADVELALWAANPQGVGVVLIAGTGSNCFGRTQQGETAKAGGMSEFFSDEGSGFMLGWEALHAVGKMHDGRMERTALYGQVLAAYQAMNFAQLKNKIIRDPSYKHAVAQVAPVVQALAREGDPVASGITAKAVDELFLLINTVYQKLNFQQQVEVYLVGGTFKDDYYRQLLQQKLISIGLMAQSRLISDPAVGAIYLS